MKIGICDDSMRDREAMKGVLLPLLCDYDTLECFAHGAELLESHDEKPFDVLFLDIGLPHLNGIDVAKEIRCSSRATHIIFVTRYRDYAAESYAVKAFYYLNKPIEPGCVAEIFGQARDSRMAGGRSLEFLADHETVYIEVWKIIYAETMRNKIRVHTYDKTFDTCMTLRELERQLEGLGFYRTHASYLINLRCVRSIHGRTVTMESGVKIPVGKTRRVSELKAAVLFYRRMGS